MSRDVRRLLARLEAQTGMGFPTTPETDVELEQSNHEVAERMEAHPTGRLALEVLDRSIERHGIKDDADSLEVIRKIIQHSDEAERTALDLIGVIGWGSEPSPKEHELLTQALNTEGDTE